MSDVLAGVWKELENCSNLLEVMKLLESKYQSIDGNRFRVEDYYLVPLLSIYADQEAESLAVANGLGVKAAPTFEEVREISDGESVMVLSFPGADDQNWIKLGDDLELSSKHVEQVRSDLEKLAEAGWYHPYATKGVAHWRYIPGLDFVALESWGRLRPISSLEREELPDELARIPMVFGLKS